MSDEENDIFVGTPTLKEVKEYFLKQKRLADIHFLEATPSPVGSPCLNETFQIYLNQRRIKAQEEMNRKYNAETGSPVSSRVYSLNDTTINAGNDETMMRTTDESFMEMERMCEKTMQNNSRGLIDLTELSSDNEDCSGEDFMDKFKKGGSNLTKFQLSEMTLLNDVEAPSFMFDNTLFNNTVTSPLCRGVGLNRPSTIEEESTIVESTISNKTSLSSYRTAHANSTTEMSEKYQTASDESWLHSKSKNTSADITDVFQKPKIRSFYTDLDDTTDKSTKSVDYTKDSLNVSGNKYLRADMSKDSLNGNSTSDTASSFSDMKDSLLETEESDFSDMDNRKFNDTLEEFEFMMEQAAKLQPGGVPKKAKSPSTPKYPNSPVTPSTVIKVQQPTMRNSPASKNLFPKVFSKVNTGVGGSASKSPFAKGSPATATNFKKPFQPTVTSKIPHLSHVTKKFSHVASPIARYINHTPELPLATTARVPTGSVSKGFNFRDSDSFAINENDSYNSNQGYKPASLPCRAKTKNSCKEIYDFRDNTVTPGGEKINRLLVNSSPLVTTHEGRLKSDRPKIFENLTLNETRISEMSFNDLSLMSGDVSVQVLNTVKRL
ncbi:unnamed protein product [Diamesa tonsa]